MTTPQPNKRIIQLRDLISQYSYEYNVLDAPTIDNSIYDSLFAELKKLEAENPDLITPDSPTQRVGSELSEGFLKVKHQKRMLSLNDVFDRSEVEAWLKRIDKLLPSAKHEFFVDIKMDGLACALIYQDGILKQAVTRGDSFIGEDVTENVRTIKNVPLSLRKADGFEKFLKGRTEIRGEIVILKQEFEKLNQERVKSNEPEFANPRNLAAGTIRQLDPRIVALRPLHFRAYDLIREDALEVPTNMFAYEALSQLGLTRNQQATVFADLNSVMVFIDSWDTARHNLPFNTDGLVVKVNDRLQFEKLGIVGKQPRAAIAYKYAAEKATTIIRDIVISLGRTGAATPVAVFDPIFVAGSTVRHASLHNADEIKRKDIRVGDTVVVYKAGDIIPQIESVLLPLRPKLSNKFDFMLALSTQYPDLKFERPEGEAVYRVKGVTGPILLSRAVQHFASKAALDIDTLGDKNVEAIVEAGLVKDVADIYQINYEQLLELDRFAKISANKLIEAINNSKTPTLERFIYGLGIRHVGTQTAIDLANSFKSLQSLQMASIDELRSVDGVGSVVAESILGWFADSDNEDLIKKFIRLGISPVYIEKTGKLVGKNFVITGSLSEMSRDEAADKIRSLGGIFQTAIAKDTTYLVVANGKGGGKLEKAKKLKIEIINEDEFLRILK